MIKKWPVRRDIQPSFIPAIHLGEEDPCLGFFTCLTWRVDRREGQVSRLWLVFWLSQLCKPRLYPTSVSQLVSGLTSCPLFPNRGARLPSARPVHFPENIWTWNSQWGLLAPCLHWPVPVAPKDYGPFLEGHRQVPKQAGHIEAMQGS